ncbi:MAG: hypothetical protein K2Y22_17860 [Candidatus Obscuribacterales bacterium]|nr:hypothetical protein [Candidatus Obscuribacterales bacterium]
MVQPKKKPSLEQVLKLVDQLSPEDLIDLRHELDTKVTSPTWSNVDLHLPSERAAFFKQEEAQAGKRVKKAFEDLQKQGIVDKNGTLLKCGLPADMEPGSDRDVGG